MRKTIQQQLLEQAKAQTKLLQEIYKQILNPWAGKDPLSYSKKLDNSNYFHIIDDGSLKTSEILQKCREKFDVWSNYDDARLDKDFPPVKSDRKFRKNVEADEEYKNKSANELEEMRVKGITIRERLLMELQYFQETGKHLDIQNFTLCSGSRDSDGYVPSVYWRVGIRKLCVGWYRPGYSFVSLRARAAVL